MNRIGRRRTVLLSIAVTIVSLVIPIFGESFGVMLISFSLLGIGNTLMQTSLNPLISSITKGNKLASTLTFGQFVKAIASFLAPFIALWGATGALPLFGLGWRVLFPFYTAIAVLAILWLGATPIEEEQQDDHVSNFGECFALMRNPFILLCFLAIMCHVGIDVGTNTTAPKLLEERLGLSLDDAAFATSLYFIFRTIGCLTGSVILQKLSTRKFMLISVGLMLLSMIGMMAFSSRFVIYASIALVGYGNSNVFSMAFSEALLALPNKRNEVSGLMIMGLFGGTLFPLAMGLLSDAIGGQSGAIMVMTVGVVYLMGYAVKLRK